MFAEDNAQVQFEKLRREPSIRGFALREVHVVDDKLSRAFAWLNLAEARALFLVRGPWIDEFIDEICRFPSGRFDDQVDAVSIAVSMLNGSQKNRRIHSDFKCPALSWKSGRGIHSFTQPPARR